MASENVPRHFQTLPDAAKRSQTFPDVPKAPRSQTLPNRILANHAQLAETIHRGRCLWKHVGGSVGDRARHNHVQFAESIHKGRTSGKHSQTSPGAPGRSQTLPDTPRRSQTLPDTPRQDFSTTIYSSPKLNTRERIHGKRGKVWETELGTTMYGPPKLYTRRGALKAGKCTEE